MSSRSLPGPLQREERPLGLEGILAFSVVLVIAVRYRFPPDIPIGFLVSAALLPVTAKYVLRYRGALVLVVFAISAAVFGVLITFSRAAEAPINSSLLTVHTVRVIGLALVLACLLWARATIGTRRVVLAFALGSFVSLGITGLNFDNIWKFSISVPVILLVLSLPLVWRHPYRELMALGCLVIVSALGDSRSLAAMLVITGAVILIQARTTRAASRPQRAGLVLLRIGVIGLAAYLAVQAAILEGMLGEAAQARTEMQIERSGSAIVGGRPEMGAAIALISARPTGYGPGTLVTYDVSLIGKGGMAALGYDPNNGYVNRYMFGNGLEVHSVLGNLWLLYGLAGAILAIAILLVALRGAADGLARGALAAAPLFLTVRLAWDFAFSPFASAMLYLPLALAIVLQARQPDPGPGPHRDEA